ncbi:hypothetical protein H1R20_g2697, partial [Candolleomyces eurysporus]
MSESELEDCDIYEDPENEKFDDLDEEISEQDSESELSDGEDLGDDLYEALSENFEFTGSFYHCSTDPNAPNPGLTIDGVGLVPLPLTEGYAKVIISRSTQAPFGKGEQTLVDTSVRDTWEIEPNRVFFQNPHWKAFVDKLASKTIWTALGVAPYSSQPRCELYKLLLYQTGSHFRPHQDTAKANGMFATIIIVLPSAFEGGQVHLSHAGQKKIIDIAKDSAFTTSFFAWYTDVVHEVKPVTAGYRLALSYNLIHTSRNEPHPSLPDMSDALAGIRRVLRKWNEDKYDSAPSPPYLAYLLEHQYSENDLNRGSRCLKGVDAHKVAHLLPIAKDLSFSVCIAKLVFTRSGWADPMESDGRGRWGDWNDDSDDDGENDPSPSMGELDFEDYEVSNVVRISGGGRLSFGKFKIPEESLLPREPFDGLEPDRCQYEGGYMGNYAGTLEHWYDRSVLVIFRDADEAAITLHIKGNAWGLEQLESATDPSSAFTRDVAAALLDKLQSEASHASTNDAVALMRYAVACKDDAFWNQVLPYCGSYEDTVGTAIGEALKVFGPDAIRPGILDLLRRIRLLKTRLNILKTIMARIEAFHRMHPLWADGLLNHALSTYTKAAPEDVPTLVNLAVQRGLGFIQDIIIPNILKLKAGKSDFFAALAGGLNQNRQRFPPPLISGPGGSPPSPPIWEVIRQCVLAAFKDWSTVLSAPLQPKQTVLSKKKRVSSTASHPNPNTPNPKVKWICDMADLCLSVNDLHASSALHSTILQDYGDLDSTRMFKEVLTPLMPQLRATLQKHGKRVTDEPFSSFFKETISRYLAEILGPKSAVPRLKRRNIGCGCGDCNALDIFINNAQSQFALRARKDRREHLEYVIQRGNVMDRVKYTTDRSTTPQMLVVSKRPEILTWYTWDGKQAAATAFLNGISGGDNGELRTVMGESSVLILLDSADIL